MACQQKRSPLMLWLLGGALAIALAWPLDSRVDAALAVTNNPPLHQFAWWCSKLGEGWATALAGIFFAVLFLFLNRPLVAAKIIFVTLTCEITGLAATSCAFWRAAPVHWPTCRRDFIGSAIMAIGLRANTSSVPFRPATPPRRWDWRRRRGWCIAAGARWPRFMRWQVMWSRIALQCHHLSDVIASIVLAIPLAVLSKHILLPFLEAQFNRLRRIDQQQTKNNR